MLDILFSKDDRATHIYDKVNSKIVLKTICEYATKVSCFQYATSVTDINPHVSPGTSMV